MARGGDSRHEVFRDHRLVALARDLPQQTAWLPKESARRARLEMLDMVFSEDIVQLPTFALAHDFASGGSVQTREHITNNSPTVEQEEDEV